MLKQQIDEFLTEKSVGVVGVSRMASKFGNTVYRKLKDSGHEPHPVHPVMESMDGDKCVSSVRELPADVRALMVVVRPEVCSKVLEDVSGTNISRVWVFHGFGKQADVESRIASLSSRGVSVISGQCPLMFLEPLGFHGIHRFFARLFGKYPK